MNKKDGSVDFYYFSVGWVVCELQSCIVRSPRKRLPSDSLPTTHNFAKDDDTVGNELALQLECLFTRFPTTSSFEESGEVTLIYYNIINFKIMAVVWLGINDCEPNCSNS